MNNKILKSMLGESYEWLDGELWFRGHPLSEENMTDHELRALRAAAEDSL